MVLRFLGRLLIATFATALLVGLMVVGAGYIALNTEWTLPPPRELGQPSELVDASGDPWYRFRAEIEYRRVDLEAISPHLRDAVVATEDHRFYSHPGVDPLGVVRAVYENVNEREVVQGASTLTQQYVKNTFVGSERTLNRKVREAVLAIQIEKDMSKDEILEAYLNRSYFGEGAYGAEAAALTFFSVPASQLTLPQAATIASTLGRPAEFSPIDDPDGALVRRNTVLEEMARYGLADRAEVDAAIATPLGLNPAVQAAPQAPYLVEEIRRQMLAAHGPDVLYKGGLTITSTVELDDQALLEQTMQAHLPAQVGFEPAVAVVDPREGHVVAAWSGRGPEVSQVDLALHPDYGRPSGSTFKTFALAAALEQGYTLDSRWPAPSQVRIGDWSPRGGGCGGRCSLLQATASSINTVYAQVAQAVGSGAMTQMATRLGVRSTLRENDLTQVLGTSSVTALDMASAFGALANDGVACPAQIIERIAVPEGATPIAAPDPRQPDPDDARSWARRIGAEGWQVSDTELSLGRCHRAVAPEVARQSTIAMQAVVAGGTGRRADIGRPQAGKTGTTTDSAQVWFVGYTPDLSISVMVSHIDGDIPLRNLEGCGSACFGGQLPATIWADVASTLLADTPPTEFLEPTGEERNGDSPDTPRGQPARRPAAPAAAAPAPAAQATPDATAPAPSAPPPSQADPTQAPPPAQGGGIIDGLLGGDEPPPAERPQSTPPPEPADPGADNDPGPPPDQPPPDQAPADPPPPDQPPPEDDPPG